MNLPTRRSHNRAARRVAAQGLLLVAHVEGARYVRSLQKIMRQLHRATMDALRPHLGEVAHGPEEGAVRMDAPHSAWKKKIDNLEANIAAIRAPVGKAFDLMASRLNKKNHEAAKTLLGFTPAETRTAGVIGTFREQNLALMEKAGRDYVDDVRDVMDDPDVFGLRVEALAARLQERAGVSESRAALIARDQTLKINGQLNQTRQENAGVLQYVWSTSKDERVRPLHAELDGTTQSWMSPPVTDKDDNTNHPGQDFQCRCVGIPVISGGPEESEEE